MALENRQWVAQLIRQVLSGEITPNDAIKQCDDLCKTDDESILRALHALYHYRDDTDIRQKDIAYKKMQENALESIADRLAMGQLLSSEQGYW